MALLLERAACFSAGINRLNGAAELGAVSGGNRRNAHGGKFLQQSCIRMYTGGIDQRFAGENFFRDIAFFIRRS